MMETYGNSKIIEYTINYTYVTNKLNIVDTQIPRRSDDTTVYVYTKRITFSAVDKTHTRILLCTVFYCVQLIVLKRNECRWDGTVLP